MNADERTPQESSRPGRGGPRPKGIKRPDPDAAAPGLTLWAELISQVWDELYVTRDSTDRLGLVELARMAHVSQAQMSAVFNGKKPITWEIFRAIITGLGGDPASWEPRWKTANGLYRQGVRLGTWRPLPGVNDPSGEFQLSEGVRDWEQRKLAARLRQGLRRATAGVAIAALAALPLFLSLARWQWVSAAVLAAALVAWIALAWHRRRTDRARRREIILRIVKAHAADLLDSYRTTTQIPPHFGQMGVRKNAPIQPYPHETTVVQVFDDAAQNLMLISDAGMGKTTQMALLAEALAMEALAVPNNKNAVLPLLVSLSTYAGQPFEDWLVRTLSMTHAIHPDLVAGLLAGTHPTQAGGDRAVDDVLLLLDGLDEIPDQAHRRKCAKHISEYRQRCVGLAVSCRSRDINLAAKITGLRQVVIDRPDRAAVQDFLTANDAALSDVREALEFDQSLWELLQSPLMLNIIHRTYTGRPATELRQSGNIEERRARIFDAYLKRMLNEHRQNRPSRYQDPERTLKWLAWLARTLTSRGEQILYLDRLSESWIPVPLLKFTRQLPRFIYLAISLSITLGWLGLANLANAHPPADLTQLAIIELAILAISFANILRLPGPSEPYVALTPVVLITPLALGSAPLSLGSADYVLTGAFLWSLLTALSAVLLSGYQPVEQLQWSLRIRPLAALRGASSTRQILLYDVLSGCALAFMAISALRLFAAGFPSWLTWIGFVLALGLGVGGEPSLRERRSLPNEGIRRSAATAITLGLLYTLMGSLGVGALIGISGPLPNSAQTWLFSGLFGLMLGASQAFRYGGIAVLHYWTIRSALWRLGNTPPRYQQFLHDAESRALLQRVGSGFAFPHRLLQEHLNTSPETLLKRIGHDQDAADFRE